MAPDLFYQNQSEEKSLAKHEKMIYQISERLKLAHQGHKALRLFAEMDEDVKEALLHLIAYVAIHKSKELEQVLLDVKDGLYPMRMIENDATVEREAVELKQELSIINQFANEFSLFNKKFIEELKDRAYIAEQEAERVRLVRERRQREQEEAVRGGAIPFPDSAVG